MAIEFRCTQCDKLLRTGDDTAGKQAKCPECGTVSTIPALTPPAGPPVPPPGAQSPFGSGGEQPPPSVDPANPYASPAEFAVGPKAPVASRLGELGWGKLDFSEAFGGAWQVFSQQVGILILGVFIAFVLYIVGFIVLYYGPLIAMVLTGGRAIMLVAVFVGYLTLMVFIQWLFAGVIRFVLPAARGEAPNLIDVFLGGPYLVRFLLVLLLFFAIYIGILLVTIVPGALLMSVSEGLGMLVFFGGMFVGLVALTIIYLIYAQAFFLIVDRDMGVIDALRTSQTITRGNRLMLFLVGLVGSLIYMVSALPCGLGLILSLPYLASLGCVAYLTMSGQATADQLQPQPTQMRA